MTDTQTDFADAADITDESDVTQFVSFFLNSECFAFPMDVVKEIIRLPHTVSVPQSPPVLVGLANLRGDVLPVVDLRGALGLDTRAHDDRTRVIVVEFGYRVGLIVDRVSRVMNVDPEQIESAKTVEHALRSEEVTGVIKTGDDIGMVQLLDASRVMERNFPEQEAKTSMGIAGALQPTSTEIDEDDHMLQLVSLDLDGEEYAFRIEHVAEIVRVPEKISKVPSVDSHVLGLITLRNRLLPLVSLRRIFGLSDADKTDTNRVIVIRMALDGGDELRVGVVVDQVREVLRIPETTQGQLPGVLRRGDRSEIGAICQLDGGKRLVSILSAGALFQQRAFQEAIELKNTHADAQTDAAETEDDLTMDSTDTDEAQLVIFQLHAQEYGVDIHKVQEIIRVPEALSHVPHAPPALEGVINLRGSVLPVVELRRQFGLEVQDRNDRQRILVLSVGGTRTGFIVDSVTEVLRVPASVMETAPRMSEDANRLIASVAKLETGKRMLLVLDASALVAQDTLADISADLENAKLEIA